VFGSVAAERPLGSEDERPFSPAARAVLERVHEEVASSAESIVAPILDRAVAEGAITRAQRHTIVLELSDQPIPARESAVPDQSQSARRVLREALGAVNRAAPGIARPILEEAVEHERLTPAQQRRILERLRISPARAVRSAIRSRIARVAPTA